jgi:undecaprenyl-diphosphatase
MVSLIQKGISYFMKEITFFGGFFIYCLFIILFYLLEMNNLLIVFLWGFLLLHLIPILIRMVYFKERPKRIPYEHFLEKLAVASFPSVHTARAFFIGAVLYLESVLVGSLFLLIAFLVGFSRIYLRRHYFVDVLFGAILGVLIAVLLI